MILLLLLLLPISLGESCDNFSFTPFGPSQGSSGPSTTSGTVFVVSSTSALTGGVASTFYANQTAQVSLYDGIKFSNLVAQHTVVLATKGFASFAIPSVKLEPGIQYMLTVYYSPNEGVPVMYKAGWAFPLSSEKKTFNIVDWTQCQENAPCLPLMSLGQGGVNGLAPTICDGVVAQCNKFQTCAGCSGTVGCGWCIDSGTGIGDCQSESPDCRTQITNPKFCPPSSCHYVSDCLDCATIPSCVWCLPTATCNYFANSTCSNRIGNPFLCPAET